MSLQAADDTLAWAVAATVEALDLEPEDAAAARLAKVYALAIDAGVDVSKFGPALLRCLEQMGATPAARAEIRKRAHDSVEESALARLRARRPG